MKSMTWVEKSCSHEQLVPQRPLEASALSFRGTPSAVVVDTCGTCAAPMSVLCWTYPAQIIHKHKRSEVSQIEHKTQHKKTQHHIGIPRPSYKKNITRPMPITTQTQHNPLPKGKHKPSIQPQTWNNHTPQHTPPNPLQHNSTTST